MPTVAKRYATAAEKNVRLRSAPEDRAPVILMVSGGADSTALLVLAATSQLDLDDGFGPCRIARERLHVLHINHQLRPIDAEEDEEFVRQLSARFGIPCTVERAPVAELARAGNHNVEDAGREVRYAAATRLANELSDAADTPRAASRILTAHTANDRAETFLMNALRGSGTSGLASIPRRRGRIVRPLLDRTHEELCELLRMRGIVWREDATNADTHYLRSYIRHQIVPALAEKNPRVVSALAAGCELLSDEDAYLSGVAQRTLHDLERQRTHGMLALDAARLRALDVAIARRVLRAALLSLAPDARLEQRHIADCLKIVAAGQGSVSLVGGIDCRVAYGLLFVRGRQATEVLNPGWLQVPGTFELPGGRRLIARLIARDPAQDADALARAHAQEWEHTSQLFSAAALGLSQEGGQLWVESPQPGDLMCPLGMHGQSKRISDLLQEAKIAPADRAGVPVVHADVRGNVVWVAPLRADERYKVTQTDKTLVELSIQTDA